MTQDSRSQNALHSLLLRASTGNAIVLAMTVAAAFLIELVLARVLGTSGYGIYVYAVTITSFAVLAARFGIDHAIIRFVPAYAVKQQWDRVRGLLRQSLGFVLLASVTLMGVFQIVIVLYLQENNPELAETLQYAIWLIPGMALGNVYLASARSFKIMVYPQFLIQVLPIMLLAATVYTFRYTEKMVFAPDVAMYKAAYTIMAVLVLAIILRSLRPNEVAENKPCYVTREWFGTGIVIFTIMIMTQVVNQTGTMLLGAMVNTDLAGIYNAAGKVAMLASFPLMAVNIISTPLISELHSADRKADLEQMLKLITAGTFAVTLLIIIGLLVLGEWVLGLFGNDFPQAYPILCILLVGQVFIALAGPSLSVMVQTGQHSHASIIMLVIMVLNLAVSAVLIPAYGMYGAATASTVTLFVQRLVLSVYLRKHMELDTSMLRFLRRDQIIKTWKRLQNKPETQQ